MNCKVFPLPPRPSPSKAAPSKAAPSKRHVRQLCEVPGFTAAVSAARAQRPDVSRRAWAAVGRRPVRFLRYVTPEVVMAHAFDAMQCGAPSPLGGAA